MSGRDDFSVGQMVLFGRDRGEKTLGTIIKLNQKTARVMQHEERGVHKVHQAGKIWAVDYSLMAPVDDGSKKVDPDDGFDDQASIGPIEFNPYDRLDNAILDAIFACHSELSPESLTGDGELPRADVQLRYQELHRKLRHLCLAYGGTVTETEAFNWQRRKKAWYDERNRQRKSREIEDVLAIEEDEL